MRAQEDDNLNLNLSELTLKFEDMEYGKRREIMRYEYLHNSAYHKAITILAFEVQEYLKGYAKIKQLENLNYIIKFLVDGFIAFELIYNPKNECLAGVELDPITLESEMKNNQRVWVQYRGTEKEKQFSDLDILYVSYAEGYALNKISFMECLHTGLIIPDDFKFIKKYAKEIANKLS